MRKARTTEEWWESQMMLALIAENDGSYGIHTVEVMKEKALYELRVIYWHNVGRIRLSCDWLAENRFKLLTGFHVRAKIATLESVNRRILKQIKQLQQ